jgi:hypothetical protein
MALMYVAYVCVTFWVSRHDDPLQADVALHEVPQDEGVGESHMQRNHRTSCCYGPCLTAACACKACEQQSMAQPIPCMRFRPLLHALLPAASTSGSGHI